MKKIIYIMTLGILFLASYGQANAAWNTYPSDCPNPLTIGNYTTGEGIQDGSNGCWTRKSVSADAGQTINVAIFFDNTNTTDANNVVVNLSQSPAGSMSSKNSRYTFSGSLSSSTVSSLSLSQVTANLSSSETLTFSKARIYKKGSTSGATLPNGQTGYEAFTGGLSLGTITKDDWGTILFSFSVGTTVTPTPTCSISNFTSNTTSIEKGSSATLSWNTKNCNSVTLSTTGPVGNSGSYTVSPQSTTTYTLNATGANGADSKSVTITVTDPVQQLCKDPSATNYNGQLPCRYAEKVMSGYLTASPTSCTIPKNASSCQVSLNWNTTNPKATSLVTLPDRTVVFTGNSGTKPISVSNGYKTYYLENNGSNLDEERVSASCASGSTWSGTYCAPNVIPPTSTCKIDNFNANYSNITKGEAITLSWNTTDCSSASISGSPVSVDGQKPYTPQSTTTYTLNAIGSNNSDFQSIKITVNEPQPATMSGNISASPSSCSIPAYGNSCDTNLSWNTTNPKGTSSVTKSGGQTVATGNSNSKTVSVPHGATSFYLYNSSILLDSVVASASCASGSSWNNSYCAPTVNPTCTINSFTASPTSINKGSTSTLNWNTTNCNSANISGSSVSTSGYKTVDPQSDTTYILSVSGANGSDFKAVTVSVNYVTPTNNCSISSFTVNGRSSDTVDYRERTTLDWSTNNCTSVSVSPYVSSNLKVNDSRDIYPTYTSTYVLTAYGPNNSNDSKTVRVTVEDEEDDYCMIDSFSIDDREIEYGDETRIRWSTNNCDSVSITNLGNVSRSGNTTISPSRPTTYEITAYGNGGVRQRRSLYVHVVPYGGNRNNTYCTIDNFSASQNYVNTGSPVTLNWNTNNCNGISISGIGPVSTYGSRVVYPTGTTNYLLTAYGPNGESLVRSVSVATNNYVPVVPPVVPVTPVYNSCAVTTVATNITGNTATLNGIVSGYGNAYFEYGTTVGLGYRTQTRTASSGVPFSETISGLSANSIYYFRFVADCQGTTNQGAIDFFKTLGSSIVRPVIVQGTTVVGQASPIMLKIENRYEAIARGDTIEYTVTYKNISKSTLRNPILQVIVPSGVTIKNASRGTYQEDTRTLTVELNDVLYPEEEGVLYVQGYVVSNVGDTAKIVSTAILVYTTPNGAQENAIAYVLNIPKNFVNGNTLGAAAFFSGFSGFGLIWWLLIIILILIIILLIRRYFITPRNTHNNIILPPNQNR